MDSLDTFTLLPLQVDPQTKAITTTDTADAELQTELAALTALHKSMVGLDTPNGIPPPPMPVNPQRTKQVNKMKDSGNDSLRKKDYPGAIRMYTFAIDMAAGRPAWEPVGLVREELALLYANRAQAHMAMREWADGLVDALASLEAKKAQNPKAWWRRAKCLMEMRRYEEAVETARQGLEFEFDADLKKLLNEAEKALEKPALADKEP